MKAVFTTPTKAFPPPSRLSSTRNIIPSPEKVQPLGIVLISPTKRPAADEDASPLTPRKRIFGRDTQDVTADEDFLFPKTTHLTRLVDISFSLSESLTAPPPQLTEVIGSSKHIVFDFILRNEYGLPRNPSDDELEVLINLFPRTRSVMVIRPMLVVVVESLPKKPWPLSVAGLPLYITTDDNDFGWDWGDACGGGPKALEHLDSRYNADKDMFKSAMEFFDTQTKVPVCAITWVSGRWHVDLPEGTKPDTMPRTLARSLCRYHLAPITSPPEAAQRRKQHDGEVWDASSYGPHLRPGVMISCPAYTVGDPKQNRDPLFTTSGLKVMKDGQTYVTVAAHGFPLGEEDVFHPGPPTRIGQVETRLSNTDIALVRLQRDISYSNTLFENRLFPARRIQEIRDAREMKESDALYMDNPFISFTEGMYVASRFQRVPVDEPVSKFQWVHQLWYWTGQGNQSMDGSCGSVVTDDDARAACFFRFLTEKGFALGVAASELTRFGFQVCKDD